MEGTVLEERERSEGRSPGPLGPGSLLSSQAGSPPPKPHQGHVGPWGHRREAKGRPGEAGGRGPARGAREE